VQQPQIPEEVDDLLLVVVVATCRPEGRQPGCAQLLLVSPGAASPESTMSLTRAAT
jgi:hypothetical protein